MFAEAFRAGLAEDGTVICITLAAALSATHSAACQAAELVDAARISVVDSHTMAMPISYMALDAARAARAGAGHAEVVARIEALRAHTVAYIGLDTLRYLEKGGRIGKIQALVGTLLNVKPILEVRDSAIRPVAQVRTSKRIPERLIELAQQRGRYAELSVMYTTDRAAAAALADACATAGLLERERIGIVQIGAVLGTHIGPGALAITGLLHETYGR
jgi:DegV family protein with EDD domain